MIYHGVRHTASGSIYRLGLALFDLERPDVCLQRGDSWMFGPEALRTRRRCERRCVSVRADNRRGWRHNNLYYGAADSCMAWPRAAYALCLPGWKQIPVRETELRGEPCSRSSERKFCG